MYRRRGGSYIVRSRGVFAGSLKFVGKNSADKKSIRTSVDSQYNFRACFCVIKRKGHETKKRRRVASYPVVLMSANEFQG